MLEFDTRHITVGLIIVAVIAWLSMSEREALSACLTKGVQSNATCEAYTR